MTSAMKIGEQTTFFFHYNVNEETRFIALSRKTKAATLRHPNLYTLGQLCVL